MGPEGPEGRCTLVFAEGTELVGDFVAGRIQRARISYPFGARIDSKFAESSDFGEYFLNDFTIKLVSGYTVRGFSNRAGFIERADLLDMEGKLKASYIGSLLEIVSDLNPDVHVLISKFWIYEGHVSRDKEVLSQQPLFNAPGFQYWIKGIGYH